MFNGKLRFRAEMAASLPYRLRYPRLRNLLEQGSRRWMRSRLTVIPAFARLCGK